MSKQAIMVLGHGSRDPQASAEFTALVEQIQARMDGWLVGHGWLEFARPTIGEGLELLRQAGATDILAVPGMLFAAGHVKNDLPSELHEFAHRHPEVRIRMGRDLSIDPKLLRAAADRIEAAWEQASEDSPDIERKDSLLLVVGRGTSDPDANGNVAKVARMLGEGLGFGFVDCAFSGVAHPRTGAALERWMRLQPKRVLVFPYFLFSGILVTPHPQRNRGHRRQVPRERNRRSGLSRPASAGRRILHRKTPRNRNRRYGDELPTLQIPQPNCRL